VEKKGLRARVVIKAQGKYFHLRSCDAKGANKFDRLFAEARTHFTP
jgi:hypothetical protein